MTGRGGDARDGGGTILIESGGRGGPRGGGISKNRADARKLRISAETSYECTRFFPARIIRRNAVSGRRIRYGKATVMYSRHRKRIYDTGVRRREEKNARNAGIVFHQKTSIYLVVHGDGGDVL